MMVVIVVMCEAAPMTDVVISDVIIDVGDGNWMIVVRIVIYVAFVGS